MKHWLLSLFALFVVIVVGVALWPSRQSRHDLQTPATLNSARQAEGLPSTPQAEHTSPQDKDVSRDKAANSAEDLNSTQTVSPTAIPRRKAQRLARHLSSRRQTGRRKRTRKRRRWIPTHIIIPDIRLNAKVVQGVSKSALRRGPGHDPASVLPGEPGNCVIAAHRNVGDWWFYRLNKLGTNAAVHLRTPHEMLTYKVALTRVVSRYDTWIIGPPRAKNATPRLTLYTCTLPHSNNRIVVVANLVQRKPLVKMVSVG